MLLNMPQCTGPPSTTENYLAPTVAMLRLRNTMHVSPLEDLSWKLLVKFISITFPHFGTHFFHFQQIFEFLLCAGPCNMSWETRIKRQRGGLQTSCCGGSYMTPLPSWCTPKSKSESAIWLGTWTLAPGSLSSNAGSSCWACCFFSLHHNLSCLEWWRWWYLWCDKDAMGKEQLMHAEGVSVASSVQWACIRVLVLLEVQLNSAFAGRNKLYINFILPAGASHPPVHLLLLHWFALLSPQLSFVPPTNP